VGAGQDAVTVGKDAAVAGSWVAATVGWEQEQGGQKQALLAASHNPLEEESHLEADGRSAGAVVAAAAKREVVAASLLGPQPTP
jgi:hypothetical protein